MQCSYSYMITITKKLNLIHSYNEITTKIFYIFIADDYRLTVTIIASLINNIVKCHHSGYLHAVDS